MMERPRMIILGEGELPQVVREMLESERKNYKPDGYKATGCDSQDKPKEPKANPSQNKVVVTVTYTDANGAQRSENVSGSCFAGMVLVEKGERGCDCLELIMGEFNFDLIGAMIGNLDRIKESLAEQAAQILLERMRRR
jgi:hypothetical protein